MPQEEEEEEEEEWSKKTRASVASMWETHVNLLAVDAVCWWKSKEQGSIYSGDASPCLCVGTSVVILNTRQIIF